MEFLTLVLYSNRGYKDTISGDMIIRQTVGMSLDRDILVNN